MKDALAWDIVPLFDMGATRQDHALTTWVIAADSEPSKTNFTTKAGRILTDRKYGNTENKNIEEESEIFFEELEYGTAAENNLFR